MTEKPRPLSSMLASAQRITERRSARSAAAKATTQQEDAWSMFELVGELRFLVETLASRLAQARLYVGELQDDPDEAPIPVDDLALSALLESIGGGPVGRVPLVTKLAVNLFVPGEGFLVGVPSVLLPVSLRRVDSLTVPLVGESIPGQDAIGGFAPDDLTWFALSTAELSGGSGGEVTISLGEAQDEKLIVRESDVVLVRVWQPHPKQAWKAHSPTLSVLPVLRKIVGLDMRDSAQIDSRLAGAGLFIVPQSAQRAMQAAANLPEGSAEDVFTEALLEAMLTPVADRASASALVPLVATVPDESAALFQYVDFAKALDAAAGPMMDTAIRRFALGMNAPPELLLGTSGMNHWGAWLIQDDVVSTHLAPPLALICDALTTQYLWPVLMDGGMPWERARRYVIWFDTSDLVARPNRSTDAMELHSRGVISDEALRDETGFDGSQAPFAEDALPVEVAMAMEWGQANPALIGTPGLPAVARQIRDLLSGEWETAPGPQVAPAGAPGATPGDGQPPPVAPVPDGGNAPQTGGQPPTQPPVGNPQPVAASGYGPGTPEFEAVMDFIKERNRRAIQRVNGGSDAT